MPLDLTKLTGSGGIPGAANADYPATRALCAKAWADAMHAYAETLTQQGVPPAWAAALEAARATLETALNASFGNAAAAATMGTAFQAFGAAVAAGMAPTFLAVPPPAPPPFAATFAVIPPPSTRAAGVAAVAAIIDTWMRTGTAAVSPSPPVPWS